MLEKFYQYFQPEKGCVKSTETQVLKYKDKVPEALLHIWQSTGFGKYNDGLIEIIYPEDFESSLSTWLGKVMPNYVPIAISGFGELFYYRKLSDQDEDICLIDIQYRQIETLVWSLESFFNEFITNASERELWLREKLFQSAIMSEGKLQKHEVFTFTPILAFGGAEELQFLRKGNAQVYQELVFQMTS
jgi:hypothetical protein